MILYSKKKISNHKVFTDVEREVQIIGYYPAQGRIQFYYQVIYTKNGEDVSRMFNPAVPAWLIQKGIPMTARDLATMQPVPNPDWKEGDPEGEKYQKIDSFDFVFNILTELPVAGRAVMEAFIAVEDGDGRFDF